MSSREQKLLIFFALAGFAILNLLAFNFAKTKRVEVNTQREQAKQKLATAEMFQESSAQVTDQMTWLAEHEPQPATNQDVQTSLQQLTEREARSAGLTIKTQKPLPTDAGEGRHYHRAKIQITVTGTQTLRGITADLSATPDIAQTLAVVAAFASSPSTFTGLHTLRVKETDRVAALQTELTKLGATVTISDDHHLSLTVHPPYNTAHTPAAIDTYDDHRMAMSFALAATKIPGTVIRHPECCAKTYPEFFTDFRKALGI